MVVGCCWFVVCVCDQCHAGVSSHVTHISGSGIEDVVPRLVRSLGHHGDASSPSTTSPPSSSSAAPPRRRLVLTEAIINDMDGSGALVGDVLGPIHRLEVTLAAAAAKLPLDAVLLVVAQGWVPAVIRHGPSASPSDAVIHDAIWGRTLFMCGQHPAGVWCWRGWATHAVQC